MKLILASNNKDKLREVREILEPCGIEVISQREAGCDIEAVENGYTFEENARIKAQAAMMATGLPCVADDSGIEISAMGGAPGIHSARFFPELSYPEKCHKIMDALGDYPDRGARYCCAVVCAFPNGDEISVFGETRGTVAYELRGNGGFGYDPMFIPDGYTKTMAEITEEEKNTISHRGRAFRLFAEKLKEYYSKEK